MFSSLIPGPDATLLNARIARIQNYLRTLTESTLEGYQVEVYSAINAVVNLGNKMQPLHNITPQGPATIGDLTENLTLLSEDGSDIASDLIATENSTAQIFNLAATTQTQQLQMIRESYYASNACRYIEAFLNSQNIQPGATASLDFATGQATLPLGTSQTQPPSSIAQGPNSDPTGVMTGLAALTDGNVETRMVFSGATLELIVAYAKPTIVNRIQFVLDDYNGLELTTLTSTPDGTVFQDALADIGDTHLTLNGVSGKLTGLVILDFPPRYVSGMRIVLNDRINADHIALRALTLSCRNFTATSEFTSSRISAPLGSSILFTADQDTWGAYTTILHQVSQDGVHFSAILPDTTFPIAGPFYYKASLQRISSAFSASASPLQDPTQVGNYVLTSSAAVSLGNNIIQRTLVFDSFTGPVTLSEVPVPGTFQVLSGTAPLAPETYSFTNGILTLTSAKFNLTVTYQTSSRGSASVADLETYYSPILRQVTFEKLRDQSLPAASNNGYGNNPFGAAPYGDPA